MRAFLLERPMTDTTPGLLADYLSEHELAKQIGVTPRTLQRWRRRREGPPFTILGRDPLYRVDGFRAWLLAREIQPVRNGSRKRA